MDYRRRPFEMFTEFSGLDVGCWVLDVETLLNIGVDPFKVAKSPSHSRSDEGPLICQPNASFGARGPVERSVVRSVQVAEFLNSEPLNTGITQGVETLTNAASH